MDGWRDGYLTNAVSTTEVIFGALGRIKEKAFVACFKVFI
jgi:hypothetical protein